MPYSVTNPGDVEMVVKVTKPMSKVLVTEMVIRPNDAQILIRYKRGYEDGTDIVYEAMTREIFIQNTEELAEFNLDMVANPAIYTTLRGYCYSKIEEKQGLTGSIDS